MLDPRKRRIAENESRFRDINERLESDLRRLTADDEPVDFICECGRLECSDSVRLTISEYERVRQDASTFVVVAGHEIRDAEDVVFRCERYVVVQKNAEARPVVEQTDPRG